MAPILGIYASQISGHLFAPSGAYDSIATTTVGSGGTASVTFSSISQTYTHLQIRWLMRSNRASGTNDGLQVRFNSDTGSNYSNHLLYGDGSGAYAAAGANTTSMPLGYGSSNNNISNTFGAGVIETAIRKTNWFNRQYAIKPYRSDGWISYCIDHGQDGALLECFRRHRD